jgi:hypothetical protein
VSLHECPIVRVDPDGGRSLAFANIFDALISAMAPKDKRERPKAWCRRNISKYHPRRAIATTTDSSSDQKGEASKDKSDSKASESITGMQQNEEEELLESDGEGSGEDGDSHAEHEDGDEPLRQHVRRMLPIIEHGNDISIGNGGVGRAWRRRRLLILIREQLDELHRLQSVFDNE